MSSCTSLSSPLHPSFPSKVDAIEKSSVQAIIDALSLQKHVEGGYFVETDRDTRRVPNPFPPHEPEEIPESRRHIDWTTRAASTTIHYMITPASPFGAFHRNRGRTVHTLHRGRGRYIIIHADEVMEKGQKARIETFAVGHDLLKGEKLQWIVEGGKFKASFLLPDQDNGKNESEGLLISETVIPGFEFEDHDFMKPETLNELVTAEQREELKWLLRNDDLST